MSFEAPITGLRTLDPVGIMPPGDGFYDEAAVSQRSWRSFDRRDSICAWDSLAEKAVEPNPFYESWHLLPSLRAMDTEGSVSLLTVESDSKLVGLLPICEKRDYYGHPIPHLRNWLHANCFLGQPLVSCGYERAFWRAILRWCDRETSLPLFLHLSHVPAEGPLNDALEAELGCNRPAATVHSETRAMLATDRSAESYFEATLASRKRKELRRQYRRLSELGDLTFHRLDDFTDVAQWTREFIELEQRGWKGVARSALACNARTLDVFRYAVAGAAARGRLERSSLRLDGKPIAMLASFVTAPGAFSYKTAFDEDYARYSPGVLLQRENLSLIERPDIDWVDSCAAQDHPMIDHLWGERRTIERRSIGIGGKLRRAAFSAVIRAETGQAARGFA